MYLAEFITVTVISVLAICTPGPDFAVVTKNSLLHSRKTGFYTIIGILISDTVQILSALLGIGLVIAHSLLLFTVLKYLGAAYLIYLGIKALRAKPRPTAQTDTERSRRMLTPLQAIRQGFLTSILNPKAIIFFLSLFTQVINPSTPAAVRGLYGLEIVVLAGLWFCIVAAVFGHRAVRSRFERSQHYIERVTGVVFIALGLKVATSSK